MFGNCFGDSFLFSKIKKKGKYVWQPKNYLQKIGVFSENIF